MRHKFATFAGLMTVVNIRTSFKGNLLEKKKKKKKESHLIIIVHLLL